jgi:magnesium transporter
MLNIHYLENQGLQRALVEADSSPPTVADIRDRHTLWVDLLEPSAEEESFVKQIFGVSLPTREQMREIETSNRLYEEDGILFLTATVVTRLDTDQPQNNPITFILTQDVLITNRYVDPLPFRRYVTFAARHPEHCQSAGAILAGLLEAFVNRIADALETTSDDIDRLANEVFTPIDSKRSQRVRDYRHILERVGRSGDLNSKARETLSSLGRLLAFAQQSNHMQIDDTIRSRMRTILRDLHQMGDHAAFLGDKVQFTLDATLGMINIEQNNTLKIFSLVTVLLLPPSVIGAVFGMNFRHIPGVYEPWGFILAVLMMIVSAIVPFMMFRRRGWL